MLTILLIILVLIAIGGIPSFTGHSYGYAPSGAIGLLVIILLVYLLMGHRHL